MLCERFLFFFFWDQSTRSLSIRFHPCHTCFQLKVSVSGCALTFPQANFPLRASRKLVVLHRALHGAIHRKLQQASLIFKLRVCVRDEFLQSGFSGLGTQTWGGIQGSKFDAVFSVSRRGGRKQMRANANKRRQTLTNASKRRGENASKRKQTRANVDKRKQTLTPPLYCGFLPPPLCSPLIFVVVAFPWMASISRLKSSAH